jgi:hypothetical protein
MPGELDEHVKWQWSKHTSLSGPESVTQPHLPLFELPACCWVKDEIDLLIKIG